MIYQNSRYVKTGVVDDNGLATFKLRTRYNFGKSGALVHQFSLGDRLDGLAMTYYKDPQLWWVILEANPEFRSEIEIPYGTNLVIPSYNEVMKCLKY